MTKTETAIVSRLVKAILGAGHSITVRDGDAREGEITLIQSHSYEEITEALGSTGKDTLYIYTADGSRRVGFVYLIWGNDEDIICDCSDNPETLALVHRANAGIHA